MEISLRYGDASPLTGSETMWPIFSLHIRRALAVIGMSQYDRKVAQKGKDTGCMRPR